MNPTIIYHKGIALLSDDTHFTPWIKQAGRLDHDQWLMSKILRYCKPGSTVVDGGAYIGDHSIAYSRAVGHSGNVLCFEPNPMAFKCLDHNVGKLNNVHCVQAGLSDKRESVGLNIPNENYGMANLSGKGYIQCVRLDDYESIRNLSFIKLDLEGFEYKALEGAKETIRKHKPIMLIEMNKATLDKTGYAYNDILQWLKDNGYRYRNVDESKGLNEVQYDLLCWSEK